MFADKELHFGEAGDFPICPICSTDAWKVVHDGLVRNGAPGKTMSGRVARCGGCGVERLAESTCLDDEAYRTPAYRTLLGQMHDVEAQHKVQDELQHFTDEAVWPRSMRGKVVTDVGCGGGTLLDHLQGVASQLIAIEPDEGWAPNLRERGYHWYESTEAAAERHQGEVDVSFSIQVIEHVANPKDFLTGIRPLLTADGILVVSTPNRHDILMELLPDDFPAFFYRRQHRWTFDAESLRFCAEAAGFRVEEMRHVHRHGMANTLLWLRERRPPKRTVLPIIDRTADQLWRAWLEATGHADNLYAILRCAA